MASNMLSNSQTVAAAATTPATIPAMRLRIRGEAVQTPAVQSGIWPGIDATAVLRVVCFWGRGGWSSGNSGLVWRRVARLMSALAGSAAIRRGSAVPVAAGSAGCAALSKSVTGDILKREGPGQDTACIKIAGTVEKYGKIPDRPGFLHLNGVQAVGPDLDHARHGGIRC